MGRGIVRFYLDIVKEIIYESNLDCLFQICIRQVLLFNSQLILRKYILLLNYMLLVDYQKKSYYFQLCMIVNYYILVNSFKFIGICSNLVNFRGKQVK